MPETDLHLVDETCLWAMIRTSGGVDGYVRNDQLEDVDFVGGGDDIDFKTPSAYITSGDYGINHVRFPKPTGININMMPFVVGDN